MKERPLTDRTNSYTTRILKMLEQLQMDAVMSKFATARECQAYRSAVEDMLTMLRAVPLEVQFNGPKYGDGPGSTHWDECWRAHHGCAIAKIERDAQSTATEERP